MTVKYPGIEIEFNPESEEPVFNVISRVTRALRRFDAVDGIDEFMQKAIACESYEDFVEVVKKTVNIR